MYRENNPGDSRCKLLPLAEIVAALSQLLHTCQKNKARISSVIIAIYQICKHPSTNWLLNSTDKGQFLQDKKAYQNMQSYCMLSYSYLKPELHFLRLHRQRKRYCDLNRAGGLAICSICTNEKRACVMTQFLHVSFFRFSAHYIQKRLLSERMRRTCHTCYSAPLQNSSAVCEKRSCFSKEK